MIPTQSRLWTAREVPSKYFVGYCAGRFRRPSLIQQGNPAWREARRPNGFQRIRTLFIIQSSGRDCEEVVIDHSEKIARRKPICRRNDVRLTPTDELFSNFEGERAIVIRRAKPAYFPE